MSPKTAKICFTVLLLSSFIVYTCIMSLGLVPSLVHDTDCQVTNVSIQETKWIQDLGCAFDTKYMHTCHNCSHWPLQCCDPDKLVSNYLCQRANISFALAEKGSKPIPYDFSCTTDVVSCMHEYRHLLNVNNTFTCKKDGRGNVYFDKSNTTIISFIVIMTICNVILPVLMYLCCWSKHKN